MVTVDNHIKKGLITHKKLAQERTILANERTTLAYVRTGFGSFVLGLALIKLFGNSSSVIYTGYGALALGAVLILLGLFYYPVRKKRILSHD